MVQIDLFGKIIVQYCWLQVIYRIISCYEDRMIEGIVGQFSIF